MISTVKNITIYTSGKKYIFFYFISISKSILKLRVKIIVNFNEFKNNIFSILSIITYKVNETKIIFFENIILC